MLFVGQTCEMVGPLIIETNTVQNIGHSTIVNLILISDCII